MNKNNSHPKIKPYFPVDTQIFGKHSYYKFLKNRPKYLQKLKVERYDHIDDNVKSRRVMGIHIKRLTKSTKSVQNLDFGEFPYDVVPLNVAKDMIKRFSRVKSISLVWRTLDRKLILRSFFYLKNLQNLRSLTWDGTDESMFPSKLEPPNMEKINSKLFGFLEHMKLEKLVYKLNSKNSPYHKILNFPRCSSSIRSWSISSSKDPDILSIENIRHLLNLKRLQNLKKLQMFVPLSLDLVNQVLGTIPRPENLKSLALKVAKSEDMTEDVVLKTRELLTKYQGLEHFVINLESWMDFFSLNNCRLKGLCVEVQTICRENLGSLKESLMQQQTTIESLSLRLRFEEQPETFLEEICDFLEGISNLKKLKHLRIALIVKAQGRNDEWWTSQLKAGEKEVHSLPILPLLIKVINELKDLKDLGLYYAGASFENDFEAFFQALLLKSHTLQTFEVNLAGCKIQKRDLEILVKTLPQLKALETLKIRNLVINDPGFFNCFAEMIHRCSSLSRLAFSDVKVEVAEYNPQEMLEMFKKIFRKQNLTYIEIRDLNSDFKAFDSCEKLRLNKIYEECPHIQSLVVPIHFYHFDFPSKWRGI